MLGKNNSYKVLKIFLDSPIENFRLREIARLSGISPPSVMNYLAEFIKERLIDKNIKNKIPIYTAIRDNLIFILYKKLSIIFELNNSGLVEYLWEKLSPETIILYGSFAKGESVENSDIDLFILGEERSLDLKKFEKKLNKNIHLFFKKSFKELAPEIRNNILNGIILKGYIKAF